MLSGGARPFFLHARTHCGAGKFNAADTAGGIAGRFLRAPIVEFALHSIGLLSKEGKYISLGRHSGMAPVERVAK